MENNIPEMENSKGVVGFGKKKALKKIILALALFILLFSAALYAVHMFDLSVPGVNYGGTENAEMKKFKSYGEFLAFMEDNENASTNYASYASGVQDMALSRKAATSSGWGYTSAPSNVSSAIPGAAEIGDSVSENSDYSKTNIQVAGVDEGDIVKTDGQYIYTISGNKILIAKAVPADQAEIVSTVDLGYSPSGLYVNGDKLAVFGSNYNIKSLKEYSRINGNRNGNFADLAIYDISDRKSPKQEKQYDFEGAYQNSRMIGDYVYFVTATNPVYAYYDEVQPAPYVLKDGMILPPENNPEIFYFDFPYLSQNLTTVTAVNIKDANKDIQNATYVLDGSQNLMYVSENNIYITFSKYTSEQELMVEATKDLIIPRLSQKDQERIGEIESVKSYILNSGEKSAKIAAIFERYYSSLSDNDREQLKDEVQAKIKEKYEKISGEMQKTIIHKIAIDKGNLNYKSKGEVPGGVLNQYAMDESSDGYFRIATTVGALWFSISDAPAKSYSNLFVLDKDMKKVGEVKNIAEGESIYSIRFMGSRAYMVTFQRVDPLFVIDLQNPEQPKILGELKVPGYSTYLHPYDDNKIIGLGKNTDDRGVETGGIKLSLFDASDVSSPKEISSYTLGQYGSDSLALREPKAFLFFKEKGLLAIPAVVKAVEGDDKYNGKIVSAGLAVFGVDDQKFEFKGMIDHRKNGDNNQYYYGNGAKRSLYIGDNLYSISDSFLKINRLSDLESVKSIEFAGASSGSDDSLERWSWE